MSEHHDLETQTLAWLAREYGIKLDAMPANVATDRPRSETCPLAKALQHRFPGARVGCLSWYASDTEGARGLLPDYASLLVNYLDKELGKQAWEVFLSPSP